MADIGFLPCGGRASRLMPPVPKELIPLGWDDGRPVPLIEYSMRAMREAGVRQFMVLAAPGKEWSLARFMDSMSVDYAMAVQQRALGTGHALSVCAQWLRHGRVMYAMPDTIIRPNPFPLLAAAWNQVEQTHERCDAVLALFETKEPERFGTFQVDDAMGWPAFVTDHREKAPFPDGFSLLWGAALLAPSMIDVAMEAWLDEAWRPYAERRQGYSGRGADEFTIDDLFDVAMARGLALWSLRVHGEYVDAGTERGYREALALVDGDGQRSQ